MNQRRTVESSDGVQIVYETAGNGPDALVFVHGWSCNRSHWRNQVQEFSGRYRTIAIDLGGHGESGSDRVEWTRQAFADDVVAVMDQERVDQAALLGHSMGGGVILYATQRLGQRVAGLIGADTFRGFRSDPSTRLADRLLAMKEDYVVGASAWIESMFAPDSPKPLVNSVTDGMLATPSVVGIGAVEGMMAAGALFEIANSIDVPKFAIHALGSPVDMDEAREVGVEVRFVTTSGHFVMLEDPETFNRYVDEALEAMF